jgi:xanthosine utilization system XapX-like protein
VVALAQISERLALVGLVAVVTVERITQHQQRLAEQQTQAAAVVAARTLVQTPQAPAVPAS